MEFPGIVMYSIPSGNSREFLQLWRKVLIIFASFVFLNIFIVDCDILVLRDYVHDCTTCLGRPTVSLESA